MVDKEPIKRNTDIFEYRSDQVREILGKTPNWIINSGISVVLSIVLLLLLGSMLISYNDVIATQVVITSRNPPVYLKANTTGRLTNVFVQPDQQVYKGKVLAEIENTAMLEDIYYIKEKIKNFRPELNALDSLGVIFPSNLNLGSIQIAYSEFITQYQNFILFNSLTPSKKEYKTIQKELKQEKLLLGRQQEQLQFFQQDLELSKSAYERNGELFKKGVISKAEFENASRQYISDRQEYEGFKALIFNTQAEISNVDNRLTQSGIQGEEFKNNYRQQLENAFQKLNNHLLEWEQAYAIKSPIDGKVTVFDIWNSNQNVTIGETIFTIVPNNLEEIIGRVTLPIRNSGKVEKGQTVIIKLENYPFREWGSLKGTIMNISEVPKQGEEAFYTVYVKMADLTTSYGKKIAFKQEMQGTAEIVVEELSVLQRIFFSFREVFDRS